jgi:hypothetical protein
MEMDKSFHCVCKLAPQTYSVSFCSFGGKTSIFSSSLSYSKQFLNNLATQRADKQGVLIS